MPEHLARGYRVAGRYRLEAPLREGDADPVVWRAFDERLERQVAIRVADRDADRDELADRAAVAASLTHPRVVRIFDTGFDAGCFFTVSELLPGSLGWARLPLPPDEVVGIGAQVAEGLDHAHERGVVHGNLHAGNVLLSEQGAKVADLAIPRTVEATAADDLRALGALLYRMQTGRAPGERAASGKPLADEPPGFAPLVRRLLDGGYTDATSAASDLRALRRTEPAETRRPPLWLVPIAVVLLAGVVFAATRLQRGEAPSPRGDQPVRITGTPYEISSVQDFDPLGDGTEGRRTVALIYDGDPQTFWATERYDGDANFAGLKEGVGVIVDLGEPRTVGQAQLLLPSSGCTIEIRSSPQRARDIEGWETHATIADAGTVGAARFEPATSRWWLLWVTELTQGVPGTRDRFACAIGEADLYPPP